MLYFRAHSNPCIQSKAKSKGDDFLPCCQQEVAPFSILQIASCLYDVWFVPRKQRRRRLNNLCLLSIHFILKMGRCILNFKIPCLLCKWTRQAQSSCNEGYELNQLDYQHFMLKVLRTTNVILVLISKHFIYSKKY